MLKIIQEFEKSTVTDGAVGNINIFLKRILIEAVSENYKQMLYESLVLATDKKSMIDIKVDPPLRANERVMTGLFNNAISSIADRSRPEVLIDRLRPAQLNDLSADPLIEEEEDEDTESNRNAALKNNGHVDFLAWYDKRSIAIELKKASMDCISLEKSDTLKKRWEKVVLQTKQAQIWLRMKNKENKDLYPNPISVGLMAVVGRCANSRKRDENTHSSEAFARSLEKLPNKPGFIATYDFPSDFQIQRKMNGRPGDQDIFTPYVAFVAASKINKSKI